MAYNYFVDFTNYLRICELFVNYHCHHKALSISLNNQEGEHVYSNVDDIVNLYYHQLTIPVHYISLGVQTTGGQIWVGVPPAGAQQQDGHGQREGDYQAGSGAAISPDGRQLHGHHSRELQCTVRERSHCSSCK